MMQPNLLLGDGSLEGVHDDESRDLHVMSWNLTGLTKDELPTLLDHISAGSQMGCFDVPRGVPFYR